MTYISGSELIERLPGGLGADPTEADELIEEWKNKVNEAYGSTPDAPITAPETQETRRLVREGAFAELLRRVMIRDGYTDTRGLDTQVQAAKDELKAYDDRYATPAEISAEAPKGYIETW